MKDKLVKTGHKKNYYRFRTILRTSIFVLSLLVVSSAPIAITYTVYVVNGKENSTQVEKTKEDKSDGIETSSYIEEEK